MPSHAWVALVTLGAALVCFWFSVQVARTRRAVGVAAPAMTGDAKLERAIRIHYNTLEWMPVFLPALWLFALYWNDRVAAALGALWIVGRLIYSAGYMADPLKRAPGFLIQALATFVLLFGALGRIVYLLAIGVA